MAQKQENTEKKKFSVSPNPKQGFEDIESMEMLNVGIVGHIDHGKTTLLSRLSGKFADTHSEELKRGITIKLGYADTILEKGIENFDKSKFFKKDFDAIPSGNVKQSKSSGKKRYASFVDCPGHEMLMATMLSGAALIDVAILLIAANEGIKPQTKEHLIALQAKKIDKILIVQNKIDLVSKEQALKNYKDIKNFVKGTIAESASIIPVSAQQEINIDKIKDWLLDIDVPERDLDSPPEFLIARSFDINKPGTEISKMHGGVLAGILKKGSLSVGDEIEIKPGIEETHANQTAFKPVRTRIVSIYRGNYSIQKATPGGSLAFETEFDNVLTKTDFLSGAIASVPGFLPEISTTLRLKYELFKELVGEVESSKIDDLKMSEMLMLSINTSITVGQIKKLKGDEVEFSLKIPIVPIKGDSVGLARNVHGHWRLVGFGVVV